LCCCASCLDIFGRLVQLLLLLQWGPGPGAPPAGLSLMTMSTGWSVGGLVAGQILNRLGFRALALGGAGLMTLGYTGLALKADIEWTGLMVVGGALGVGMGFLSITIVVAVQTAIEPARRGGAAAGGLFFPHVGAALGGA